MTKLTVEETNLLSIYKTGSRQGLIITITPLMKYEQGQADGTAPEPEGKCPCTPDVPQLR